MFLIGRINVIQKVILSRKNPTRNITKLDFKLYYIVIVRNSKILWQKTAAQTQGPETNTHRYTYLTLYKVVNNSCRIKQNKNTVYSTNGVGKRGYPLG